METSVSQSINPVIARLGASCVLACLTTGMLRAEPHLTLVEKGRAHAVIVLPENTEWEQYVNATPEQIEVFARERFPKASEERLAAVIEKLPDLRRREAKRVGDEEVLALEELVAIVKTMTGGALPVVRPKPGDAQPEGLRILLGTELAWAEGLGTEIDALGPHGFLIRTLPNRLVIAGRTARGTLYGVYALLESFGCRWILPGPFGEMIPRHETLQVALDLTENPSHPLHRYWWGTRGVGEDFARWTLRNKGSYVRALGQSGVKQGHSSKQPMLWEARRRGEEQLPDAYYALQQGKPSRAFAHMANPAVWELHNDYYREMFYNSPLDDYWSIGAEDGMINDERPEVQALDSKEWDWTTGTHVVTDRILFFHRRYLDAVREEHPDRKFGMLVYANNRMPPRIETVHPAMALVHAPLGISPLHHVRDPKSKTNREYSRRLPIWLEQARTVGAESYYYDYFPVGYQWCNFIISPQWQIIGRNYPWFHEMGLDGHTTQGFDDWGMMGLTAWVAIRLYWDVTQDYNDLVADYCRIRFGERAAAAMHAYYRVFEHRMDEIPDMCSNEIWDNHLIINSETRAKARQALKTAEPLVGGDREKKHFETMELFQQAMDAWCDGIDHTRETGDFAAGAGMMEPAFEIAARLNQLYSHFVNPVRIGPDKRQFTPGGWRHKYKVWAEKINGSSASLALPREMTVALDTDNLGWARGWHRPEVAVDHLETWDTTQVPDIKYHTQREPAAFFYRTDLEVPDSFAGRKKIELFFPSIIARAMRIWINGQPVLFDHGDYRDEIWRGPAYFWTNYNHSRSFDITPHLRPGQRNTIAFRVFKSFDHGGTYDRIFLLADAPE